MTIAKNYIDVQVANRFVAVSDHTPITSGNVGVDYLRITMDDAWGGLDVKVTFLGSKDEPTTVDAGTLTKHTATDGTSPFGVLVKNIGGDDTAAPTAQLTQKSPAPFVGIIAGLSAATLFIFEKMGSCSLML